MKRVRLTREESREQTQQRLIEAAHIVIAKKGLGAVSVEDIAATAGYTRGAFYSNFDSIDDLFIELLRRDHDDVLAGMEKALAEEVDPGRLEQRVIQLYGQLYRNNDRFMNWTEARMLAARDARFRTKLNALMAEKRDSIATFIERFCQRIGATPAAPPMTMAMGFLSLIEGVKLFRVSSPQDMTDEMAEAVLTLFINAVIQLRRPPTDSGQ